MPKYTTRSGGHVSIWPNQTTHIEILAGGEYETDDKDEIDALDNSTEVVKVKADKPAQKTESKSEPKDEPKQEKPSPPKYVNEPKKDETKKSKNR